MTTIFNGFRFFLDFSYQSEIEILFANQISWPPNEHERTQSTSFSQEFV